jgi:hypothetical protein
MRESAPHEGDILHTSKAQVRHELAAPTHKTIVFFTQKTRANALPCHSRHSQNREYPSS